MKKISNEDLKNINGGGYKGGDPWAYMLDVLLHPTKHMDLFH